MTKAAVKIKDFSFKYPDATAALDNINLEIAHKERVALIGPNGAGKSTLLLAIGNFLKSQDPIEIDGLLSTKKNIKKIRQKLGVLFQDPNDQLFMPRLFDDVTFGPLNMGLPKEEVILRSREALRSVGLLEKKERQPHHLSAGEKRAAAIATVLAMKPEIITMDEPDSSLDPRSQNKLIELLNQMEQTLIIATCNVNFVARVCERIVLMDDGKIIAIGNRKEILGNQELMNKHGLEVPAQAILED